MAITVLVNAFRIECMGKEPVDAEGRPAGSGCPAAGGVR
jgi:hypothetical protein